MRFEVVAIGNELLNGDLADTNTQRLARLLRSRGLPLRAAQTVPDKVEDIVAAFMLAAERADVVLVSGGLGPTSDDLTLESAAGFAGVPLETHAPTVERLGRLFAARGYKMSDNNLRQARVPEGSEVFENPVGTAPHVQLQVGGTRFFFFPGVPSELAKLSELYLIPWLERFAPAKTYRSRVFRTFGKTESAVGALVEPPGESGVLADSRLHVAYRAHFPEIQVSLHVDEANSAEAELLLARAGELVRERLGDVIFSEASDRGLVDVVADGLRAKGETLALAESCTGGLVAKLCTDLAGSSQWFLEGLVTYSNAAKVGRLGVEAGLVEAHGAVSEEVARAMARRVREVSGATWGLALTGVAGPGGGSAEKPVGTVHIGLSGPTGEHHLTRRFPFDRDRNRVVSAYAALDLLRRNLV